MHHTRWYNHGDPLAGGIYRGSTRSFIFNHLNHESDECLIWPYGRDKGYAVAAVTGFDTKLVHRIMCILKHGPPPDPLYYATHDCGNGHLGCINPKHVSWKTPKGNSDDKKLHGTYHRGERITWSKLTENQALYIKYSNQRHADLAAEFGVSIRNVRNIQSGLKWKHLP